MQFGAQDKKPCCWVLVVCMGNVCVCVHVCVCVWSSACGPWSPALALPWVGPLLPGILAPQGSPVTRTPPYRWPQGRKGWSLWAEHHPQLRRPPTRLSAGTPPCQPHLKSPSWYLPTACRTMVTKAMPGFTTQNCSVAWEWGWGSRARVWGLHAGRWRGAGRRRGDPLTCLQKRRNPMEYDMPCRQQVPYRQLDLGVRVSEAWPWGTGPSRPLPGARRGRWAPWKVLTRQASPESQP